MRKKFKSERVCSSENYTQSRRIHAEYLIRLHDQNSIEIQKITESISVKHYFVSCFGKLVEITRAEAIKIEQSVKIIRK